MSEALNREYCEKLGWRFESDDHWHAPRCTSQFNSLSDYRGIRFAGECVGACRSGLPRLDESADLCIAELDRAFQCWIISRDKNGFWMQADERAMFGRRVIETGANFHEAALKCLIAAHKRESEAV